MFRFAITLSLLVLAQGALEDVHLGVDSKGSLKNVAAHRNGIVRRQSEYLPGDEENKETEKTGAEKPEADAEKPDADKTGAENTEAPSVDEKPLESDVATLKAGGDAEVPLWRQWGPSESRCTETSCDAASKTDGRKHCQAKVNTEGLKEYEYNEQSGCCHGCTAEEMLATTTGTANRAWKLFSEQSRQAANFQVVNPALFPADRVTHLALFNATDTKYQFAQCNKTGAAEDAQRCGQCKGGPLTDECITCSCFNQLNSNKERVCCDKEMIEGAKEQFPQQHQCYAGCLKPADYCWPFNTTDADNAFQLKGQQADYDEVMAKPCHNRSAAFEAIKAKHAADPAGGAETTAAPAEATDAPAETTAAP